MDAHKLENIISGYGINADDAAWLRAAAKPAPVADDAIEAAYWEFDARWRGYGWRKAVPQSERDAFKWAVRAMLAAQGVSDGR